MTVDNKLILTKRIRIVGFLLSFSLIAYPFLHAQQLDETFVRPDSLVNSHAAYLAIRGIEQDESSGFRPLRTSWNILSYIPKRMIHGINYASGYGFRLDQVWWPQYKKDVIDEKTLTREEAIELLGEFQIRTHETCYATFRPLRLGVTGAISTLPVPTIGGVDDRGRDACNDLTDALLEALRLVRCSMPSYIFRWHPKARIGTLKEVWSSGNWGELLSFKVFFSIGLFVFSFFIPKIIKSIRGE